MAYTDDRQVWPMLVDLASCVCAELTNAGLPGTCFCGVIPGQAALDHCSEGQCDSADCGGMAWTSALQIIPSEQLTTSAGIGVAAPRRCQVPDLTVAFQCGIVRCAPMSDSHGNPPGIPEYLDAARLQLADMAALERALLCCFSDPPVLTGWDSIGPDGGCLGGVWTATFTLEM